MIRSSAISSPALPVSAPRTRVVATPPARLPWVAALPLIGGISLGLWWLLIAAVTLLMG